MTRQEKVAIARHLAERGLNQGRIAAEMGVARTTVQGWLGDPDGSKLRARKDSYRGTCVDCGGPTDGSNGPGSAPERCCHCAPRAAMTWTGETIVAAIQRWARLHNGAPPTSYEWNPAMGRSGRARRPLDYSAVQREFGSWSEGIRAAGFERLAVGRPRRQRAAA